MSRYVCKDCGNTVIGSPICATCGAQKLYDATLRSVEQRAERAERELAAYQAEMPEAPERLTMTRNLASGMATETVVVAHRYDVLAKRCARQAVELEVARKDSKLFHQLLQLHHSDAMELFAVLQIASGAIGHIHDCVTGKSSAENDELAYIINAAENKAKECLKKHYQAYSAEARSNPAGSFNTTLAAG